MRKTTLPKQLKIGVVVDQLLPGGVQITAIEQVRNLNKLGSQAKLLILMRKKYPLEFSYLVKDIPHQYLSDAYPWPFKQTIKFPIFSFFSTLHLLSPILAPKVVHRGDYDILVSHGTTTCLTTQALWRKKKIPYLAVIHDPMAYILQKCYSKTLLKYFFPLLKPISKLIEQSFVREAQKTIIDSKVHLVYLKKSYGIKPKILPLGCKVLDKIPSGRGDYLLSFGRWQKEKNPAFLLKLIKTLPGAKLVIAGNWINQEEQEDFQRIIKKENLTKRVKLVPHYTNEKLKKLCALSRLWLHSHFEAFGLAALEAAGHGLPIIIPEKSGVTEVFQDGVHGFFPKKIDLDEYKKYIKKLLEDKRLAYKIGKKAWGVVKKNYSWKANGKALIKIIKSALRFPELANITVLETGHSLGTSLAGGDKLMEPMAIRLADKYNFTIIVPQIGAAHWQKATLEKEIKILPLNRFDQSGSPVPVFLTYCLRMWQTYLILKNQLRFNLLYSSTNILPDILPAYFAKKSRPKTVWIARIHHLIPPPYKREGRLIVNTVSYLMQGLSLLMIKTKADVIIALNQRLRKKLIEIGFPQKKLQVLGAGIEFEKIAQFKPQKKTLFEAIFLGRLHITKGIFDTILVWQEVVKEFRRAKLAVIGDGPVEIKRKLKKEIQRAKLSKNIKLLGFLPYPEVFSIMKQSKVFLFLDHEAGWGLAVAEAMACKLPVIGFDIGVLGDVFKKGYLAVPCFDTNTFAKKIINLLREEEKRKRLSLDAFSQAKMLSWEETTAKFAKILTQAAYLLS